MGRFSVDGPEGIVGERIHARVRDFSLITTAIMVHLAALMQIDGICRPI
jgi:hypothetical protein